MSSAVAETMENWLSSSDAADAMRAAIADALEREGGGSHGRNLSVETLVAVSVAAVKRLPSELSSIIPEPDAKFVRRAVAQTLPDLDRTGVRDAETLTTAVQVVLLNLATSVDLLDAAIADREARAS
jgi:hypothetical protein